MFSPVEYMRQMWVRVTDLNEDIALSSAWGHWEAASCVERHGDHLWAACGDWTGEVNVACSYCLSDVEAIHESASLDGIVGDIEIIGGKHSEFECWGPIPVAVDVSGSTWISAR